MLSGETLPSRLGAVLALDSALGSGGCVANLFSDNRPPEPATTFTPIEMNLSGGGIWSRDLALYFRDPDGDALTFTARAGPSGVVAASLSGSRLILSARGLGEGVVFVRARDPDGRTAEQSASVRVRNHVLSSPPPPPPRPNFNRP